MEPRPGRLPDGSRVAILELKSAPQYNGARADVLHYDGERGRYAIRLVHPSFRGKEMLCRPEALELIYALLPANLAGARAALAGSRATGRRLAFEDCTARWGPAVGRALVAEAACEEGETLFTEAPFLVVSNPPGLERWVRRWDCFFAVTSQAQAGMRDVAEAFEASDTGGEAVIESLMPDARATLDRLWDASGVDERVRRNAEASGHLEREVRRIATALARWQTNQHELGGDDRRALYWLAPKVAHSCGPNVGWEDPDPSTGLVELRALRRIARGEVLGVNYMQADFLLLPVAERRARLLKERKFLCVCDRCRAEAADEQPSIQLPVAAAPSAASAEAPLLRPRQTMRRGKLDRAGEGPGAASIAVSLGEMD